VTEYRAVWQNMVRIWQNMGPFGLFCTLVYHAMWAEGLNGMYVLYQKLQNEVLSHRQWGSFYTIWGSVDGIKSFLLHVCIQKNCTNPIFRLYSDGTKVSYNSFVYRHATRCGQGSWRAGLEAPEPRAHVTEYRELWQNTGFSWLFGVQACHAMWVGELAGISHIPASWCG